MNERRPTQTRGRLAGWTRAALTGVVVGVGLVAAPVAVAAPQLSRVATLTPPDATDEFTTTPLSASDDGSTVVLGAPFKRRAYIFSTAPYASPPVVTLNPPSGSGAFGTFVAISGNGSTVAIGSQRKPVAVYRRTGAARAFKRVATLRASGGSVGGLAISKGGLRIFVLGKTLDVFAPRGSARYARTARLPAGGATGLAASADGATVALSDGFDVKIFRRPARGGWARARRQAVLSGKQHSAIAIDTRGRTLVAGMGNTGSGQQGSVDVFTRKGKRWRTKQAATATLTPENVIVNSAGVADGVGASVSISPNGSEVIAGSAITPRALVFQRPAGGWRNGNEIAQADVPGEEGPWEVTGSLATGIIASDRSGRGYIFR